MWQPIGSIPINTWALVRKSDSDFSTLPVVAMFNTTWRQWVPSDVINKEDDLSPIEEYLLDFYQEWEPNEWHPLPEENSVVEPVELSDD